MDRRSGCLGAFFRLFLLDALFNWLQRNVGFGRGGCGGCGCGFILVIIFLILVFSVLFNTDWFRLFSAIPMGY